MHSSHIKSQIARTISAAIAIYQPSPSPSPSASLRTVSPIPSRLLSRLHQARSIRNRHLAVVGLYSPVQCILRCTHAGESHAHRRLQCPVSHLLDCVSTKQIPYPRLAFPPCPFRSRTAVKTFLNLDHSAALRIQSASVHWTPTASKRRLSS